VSGAYRSPSPFESHYAAVLSAIVDGRVTPLLGAGVNLCGRPHNAGWLHGQYLPSGTELAAHLARATGFAWGDAELARVSQYVAVMWGSGPLYDKLHEVFDSDYPPTELHTFLARLPGVLREKGYLPREEQSRFPLFVTTNYDDVLERAFEAAGEEFDLVWYVALGSRRGQFMHRLPDGEVRPVERPNEYRDIKLVERAAILKIHGAVNRTVPEDDSYVITEDDYISYLTQTDISEMVPVTLAAKLRRSNFLFLGYSLRDWNLRVILHRIWVEQQQRGTYTSWAIQLDPEELDQRFWRARDVEIYNLPLELYVAELRDRLERLPALAPS
jgi:hypothetical protein